MNEDGTIEIECFAVPEEECSEEAPVVVAKVDKCDGEIEITEKGEAILPEVKKGQIEGNKVEGFEEVVDVSDAKCDVEEGQEEQGDKCIIKNLRWEDDEGFLKNPLVAVGGEDVRLSFYADRCVGKNIFLKIYEDDFLGDDLIKDSSYADGQIVRTVVEDGTQFYTWKALWEDDGIIFEGNPKYFFKAYIEGNESQALRSDNLIVKKTNEQNNGNDGSEDSEQDQIENHYYLSDRMPVNRVNVNFGKEEDMKKEYTTIYILNDRSIYVEGFGLVASVGTDKGLITLKEGVLDALSQRVGQQIINHLRCLGKDKLYSDIEGKKIFGKDCEF